MIYFVSGALLMLTGVLMAFLLPLLSSSPRAPQIRRDAYDRTVYRDQLIEIDKDLERGLFSAEEADAARIEIQRRMLAAAPAAIEADGADEAPVGSGRRTAAAAVLLLPAAAAILYLELGRPGLPDTPLAQRTTEIAAAASRRSAQAGGNGEHMNPAELAQQLAKRLESEPQNADGWNLLGRSYITLGRFADAAQAYAKAAANNGRNPDTLSAWGEALTRAADGAVPPEARKLFAEAQAKNSKEPRAWFYIGLAKAQTGDIQGALTNWVALAKASPADAPWLPTVQGHIRQAAGRLGIDTPAIAAGMPTANQPRSNQTSPAQARPRQRGPSQADVNAASQMSPSDRAAMIQGMVERLANRLKESPGDRDGWLRLGRAYQVLGEAKKAEEAFAKAKALAGQ
jgi:cytochrome c-type biogenesis protein CcmH